MAEGNGVLPLGSSEEGHTNEGAPAGEESGATFGDEVLRQGSVRDYLPLLGLLECSDWVHQPRGHENLFELLTREPCALLQRGRTIRAVLLSTLYRRPVAAERILALRDSADMQPMFDLLLPYAEARLADRGAHWMSFTNGAAWLADGLVAHGYELQDRVIVYRKEDWAMARRGNPDVRVRRPTLEVLLSIVALDADAFEPFWRLNQTILKQAICDSAYYLVAELGQKIVGYLLAEKHGDEALIGRVGVAPAFQRQGIATRLMAEALALMQRDGLKAVLLNTQEDNLPSRTLYEGLGFRLTGEADTIWAKQLTSTSGAKR